MSGDVLDLVLVGAALLFAISGYRQGFVVGVLSFLGFLGGGVLGAKIAPDLARTSLLSSLPVALVGLVLVLLIATVGQVLASVLGAALRRRLTWSPARTVDALAGALVSVLGLLLVAWLVGLAVASSPYPSAASQVRRSIVIGAVNDVAPNAARQAFSSFRELVNSRGFPEVFSDLRPTIPQDVAPPDPAVAGSPAVAKARNSVLKITGAAPSCRVGREGTGFVYAPGRVMTNAHVLAGVREPRVQVGNRRLPATVVLYDPDRDLAVLRVPGLDRPALSFVGGPVKDGSSAVVVGYPLDGPFNAGAARIVQRQQATARNIYDEGSVQREIYTLKGNVRPGNSGGPLLTPDGRVSGVIFAAAADDQSTGYALTAAYAAADAQAGRTGTRQVSTQKCD